MSTLHSNRSSTSGRRRRSSWLRVDMLENRITPSWLLPDLSVEAPSSWTSTVGWPSGVTFDYFAPPLQTTKTIEPLPGAPVIAEWTRIGKEDDTIAITGDALTTWTGNEAGKDTEFIAFGQQAKNTNEALTAPIRRLDGPEKGVGSL